MPSPPWAGGSRPWRVMRSRSSTGRTGFLDTSDAAGAEALQDSSVAVPSPHQEREPAVEELDRLRAPLQRGDRVLADRAPAHGVVADRAAPDRDAADRCPSDGER